MKAKQSERVTTTIMLPNGLRVRLKVAAAKQGTSMSRIVERLVQAHLDKPEGGGGR